MTPANSGADQGTNAVATMVVVVILLVLVLILIWMSGALTPPPVVPLTPTP
ncbi:MAG TPA: hypothetical protein VM536_07165 [Chloroflexia bacterium]|nr:hypothetical protein [Chloroflexia bacterium]